MFIANSWEISKFNLWEDVEKLLKKLYEYTDRENVNHRGDDNTY